MTNQQKTKALKAHLKEVAGFIASNQWLKDNLKNYQLIDGKVYHVSNIPQPEETETLTVAEPIETEEVEQYWKDFEKECDYEYKRLSCPNCGDFYPYVLEGKCNCGYNSEHIDHSSHIESSSDHIESSSEHLNKINEAVILHHEGIKAFLNTYKDVQVIKAFHFEATDRFLIFCKDLKVKKKQKEEYCLFWWDWANRITTLTGDYVDCYFKYRMLINLMGNPLPKKLPDLPDLTEYYRNVIYCPADGKRCEQFTLSLGV